MVDFSSLLKKPAFTGLKPQPLPAADDYPGRIGKYEYGESREKKTPFLRYSVHITGWAPSVDAADRTFKDEAGTEHEIDPTKKVLRKDFYLIASDGNKGYYQLDQFLRSIGLQGGAGVTYEDMIPQAVGASVVVQVKQYLVQSTGEIGNEVNNIAGV